MDITALLFLFYLNLTLSYHPIFNCSVQKLLKQNVYANHVCTFFCLLYLVVFANGTFTLNDVLQTLLIYVLFIMLTKTDLEYVGMVLLALLIDQYISSMIKSKVAVDPKADVSKLTTIRTYIKYLVIVVILVGFVSYYFKQKKDHKNFSFLTLFFGSSNPCKH